MPGMLQKKSGAIRLDWVGLDWIRPERDGWPEPAGWREKIWVRSGRIEPDRTGWTLEMEEQAGARAFIPVLVGISRGVVEGFLVDGHPLRVPIIPNLVESGCLHRQLLMPKA